MTVVSRGGSPPDSKPQRSTSCSLNARPVLAKKALLTTTTTHAYPLFLHKILCHLNLFKILHSLFHHRARASYRSYRFMKFTSLRKSMICKFSKMSVTNPQSEQEETPTDQRDKSKRPKLRRGPKTRTSAISVLAAGCGCQSRLGVALDQIPADSHIPDVCSVQSLPSSCSSPETNKVEEQCSEWKSIVSFDEMLKWSSKSHGQEEVHYNKRSSFDNTSLELHQISYVKFNDLVSKFRLEKQITSGEFQHVRQSFASQKVKPQRQTGNISQTTSMKKMIRLADSLLIMKSSSDPRREFRDSMMEMIAENKIKDGKDLEELLAGYLLLNSADYHDVIIQVFKQIWVELIQT